MQVNPATGTYTIASEYRRWSFNGSTGQAWSAVRTSEGRDAVGEYKEVQFQWEDTVPYVGTIQWYADKPVVIFSLTLPKGSAGRPVDFPAFDHVPASMHSFSHGDDVFAPPHFRLIETATPWLFFNDQDEAYLISPASEFMISKLTGDGKNRISSGLNSEIKNLPERFVHRTILVLGQGIGQTWQTWGDTLRELYGRERPAPDDDPVLKYFGYWTDAGADYYYNYDAQLGYAPTLLALRERYRELGIPLGYMQLDSWWYEKTIYDVHGNPTADHKNPALPKGSWNRYGGLMNYQAHSFLFPDGLADFQKKLGLPLVTHNRWVDPHSPYHDRYEIAGYAATDPQFWADIVRYLQESGVSCYEQDWLNCIYDKTTHMAQDPKVGNAFTDGMAMACDAAGLTMQYCMAMPRHFMQGLKYNNLTTIRTSDDRFEPKRWKPFLYTSQLAYAMGVWPWCDVFKSREEGNMILAVLSAGPVGTGDAMGLENKDNIMKACRSDGVLVKPDASILPMDKAYLHDALGQDAPMLAHTYTRHYGLTTSYVFAFAEEKAANLGFGFHPKALGQRGRVAVFDPLSKRVAAIDAAAEFRSELPETRYAYYIVAPVTRSGIAFLGDAGKIAATGKQRIAALRDGSDGLQVRIRFAQGESSVILQGYSEKPVTADKGEVTYDAATCLFTLTLPSGGNDEVSVTVSAHG